MSKEKIGVGIITCNRPDYLKSLMESLIPCINSLDEVVVVNDGKIFEYQIPFGTLINNPENLGVAKSKNKALKFLFENNCDYIFLIEDDIVVKNTEVFKKYITACKESGIQHFNFAFHGRDNYNKLGLPFILLKVQYNDGVNICLYPNVYGAFSFYSRHCIETIGYMDEQYYNAMEHVDHTNLIIQKNMHPPFRWFADIENSQYYIGEIDSNHTGSEIRKNPIWVENFHKAATRFAKKYGFDVRDPNVKIVSKQQTIEILKGIKKKYKNA